MAFELQGKFRSFNQQHQSADTGSNSQTAAMLKVRHKYFTNSHILIMKKRKIARASKVSKRKSKLQVSVNKSNETKFDYSGYTLLTLATKLKLDEEVLKHQIEKKRAIPYSNEQVITDEIWLAIKDFILNKIELTQRHIRVSNSKKIKQA